MNFHQLSRLLLEMKFGNYVIPDDTKKNQWIADYYLFEYCLTYLQNEAPSSQIPGVDFETLADDMRISWNELKEDMVPKLYDDLFWACLSQWKRVWDFNSYESIMKELGTDERKRKFIEQYHDCYTGTTEKDKKPEFHSKYLKKTFEFSRKAEDRRWFKYSWFQTANKGVDMTPGEFVLLFKKAVTKTLPKVDPDVPERSDPNRPDPTMKLSRTTGGFAWEKICNAFLKISEVKQKLEAGGSIEDYQVNYAIDYAIHSAHNTGSVFEKSALYQSGGGFDVVMLDAKAGKKKDPSNPKKYLKLMPEQIQDLFLYVLNYGTKEYFEPIITMIRGKLLGRPKVKAEGQYDADDMANAVKAGNVELFNKIYATHPELLIDDVYQLAIKSKKPQMLERLGQINPEFIQKATLNIDALIDAINSKDKEMVKKILDADPKLMMQKSDKNEMPMNLMIKTGQVDLVAYGTAAIKKAQGK